MKTSDRILETSLLLFNDEGEQNVTTVDIANEMDISPGNLYYHFKGKEAIIELLYSSFERELSSILRAPIKKALNLQDNWFYVYVIFEEIYKFRFFYLNLVDILQRNPGIEKRFKRLVQLKKEAIETVCGGLADSEAISVSDADIKLLGDSVTMIMTYWFPYQFILNPGDEPHISIHKGVYQVMSLINPYFGENQKQFYTACQDLYEAVIEQEKQGLQTIE
jgi:AcrR family transcriptional regulator